MHKQSLLEARRLATTLEESHIDSRQPSAVSKNRESEFRRIGVTTPPTKIGESEFRRIGVTNPSYKDRWFPTVFHCAKRLGSNEEWVCNPWIRSYFVHIAEVGHERGYFSFFSPP